MECFPILQESIELRQFADQSFPVFLERNRRKSEVLRVIDDDRPVAFRSERRALEAARSHDFGDLDSFGDADFRVQRDGEAHALVGIALPRLQFPGDQHHFLRMALSELRAGCQHVRCCTIDAQVIAGFDKVVDSERLVIEV